MTTGAARAWAELLRLSNLPTVVSNAIAGAAIGTAVGTDCATGVCWASEARAAWWSLAAPPLAYLAGMILNDAFDAPIDRSERPDRPIPSGRVGRGTAFTLGFAMIAASIGASALSASSAALVATLALAASVVVYDAFHTRIATSVVLLAVSRALAVYVPIAAFAGDARSDEAEGVLATLATHWSDPRVAVLPIAVAAWTLALSTIARGEVSRMRRTPGGKDASPRERAVRGVTFLAPVALLGAALWSYRVVDPGPFPRLVAVAAAIAAGVLAQSGWAVLRREPGRTPQVIGLWIACLPLLDAVVVASAGAWNWAIACIAAAVLARELQRSLAAS